jgi:hypothetical protein
MPEMEDDAMLHAMVEAFLPEVYEATLALEGDWFFDMDRGMLRSARGVGTLAIRMETPAVPDLPPGDMAVGAQLHFTLTPVEESAAFFD